MIFSVEQFGYFVVAWLIVRRLHVYRTIRRFEGILFLSFLLYRVLNVNSDDDQSILSLIQQIIEKINFSSPALSLFVKDLLGLILLQQLINLSYQCTNWNYQGFSKFVTDYGFNLVKDLPFVKGSLQEEQEKMEKSIDKDLKTKSRSIGQALTALPNKGMSHNEVLQLIDDVVTKENVVWQKGHLSGGVYSGQKEHIDFLNQCNSYYSISNALHADIWPSVMKFESEVIAMTANLVNGGLSSVCGATSSVRTFFSVNFIFLILSLIGRY